MLNDKSPTPIATPRRRLLRLWGMQFGPVAMWLGAVALCIVIGRHESAAPPASGLVVADQAGVVATFPTRLSAVRVSLFDEVKAGEVLATLDDSELKAELNVAKKRLTIVEAQVEAQRTVLARELEATDNARTQYVGQLAREAAQASLDLLDRQLALNNLRVEYERRSLQLIKDEELARVGVLEQYTFDENAMEVAILKEELEGAARALQEWLVFRDNAAARAAEEVPPGTPPNFIEEGLEPLRREMDLVSAEIELLHTRISLLVLRAPMDGIVSELYVRSGSIVGEGDVIALVTRPETSQVIAYLPENSRSLPEVGSKVRVKAHDGKSATSATASRVGPAVVAVPLRLNRHPNVQDFAIPVLLELPAGHQFRPGQLVHVNGM